MNDPREELAGRLIAGVARDHVDARFIAALAELASREEAQARLRELEPATEGDSTPGA